MTHPWHVIEEHLEEARAAQLRWARGDSGYYVCNARTRIVVEGPFESFDVAELRAAEREPPSMGVVEQ